MQMRVFVKLAAVHVLVCMTGPAHAANPLPLVVDDRRGVVAADTKDASLAGAEILRQGGNAVDAAIATALALGVVAPTGSGLGGGGFAVIWLAKEHRAKVLDFREVAPHAASRDMYAGDPSLSLHGGLAVAVPGEPAGLATLHAELGHLPFTKIVAPAARLAQRGFFPSPRLVRAAQDVAAKLAPNDPMLRWLQANGRAMAENTRVTRTQLGATLMRFGKGGAHAFYAGPIAADIIAAARQRGGILSAEDLTDYHPIWRDPLVGQFRGRQIYAVPPPAGGVTALEALHFLDALPPLPAGSIGSSAYFHRIAEALTHAFSDRARWVGDPAFFKVPTETLASPAYAKRLAARFTDVNVLPLENYGTPSEPGFPIEPAHDHGTSHLCVMDKEGNVVALTTTVNHELGAQVEGQTSGVVLNNEMDDFAARPGQPNGFGLVGAEANSIQAGKRPTSSMTPMIVVEDGRAAMCVGGSGGPTIVASSVQAIVAVFDEAANAETAVSTPRIYAQWKPEGIMVEREVASDVVDGLARRGYKIRRPAQDHFAPAIQVILRRGDKFEAASDPRKGGSPAAP